MALQPWIVVAKDIFTFATMMDVCKKSNFMEFFDKILIFSENFHDLVSQMPYSWEISLFATVSHGCKGKIILCNHDS